MKPCLLHSTVHCKICKCIAHNITDCTNTICVSTKTIFSSQSRATRSLSLTRRNSCSSDKRDYVPPPKETAGPLLKPDPKSEMESKKAADPVPDSMITFLQQQNTSLLKQVEDLTTQLKALTEQIYTMTAAQDVTSWTQSPTRKKSKGQRTHVPSLASKVLFKDANKFDLLSDDSDDNEPMDDLSLGSDTDIFQSPAKCNDPVIAKARQRINRQNQRKGSGKGKTNPVSFSDPKTKPKGNPKDTSGSSPQQTAGETVTKPVVPKKATKPCPPIRTGTNTNFTLLCSILKNVDRSKWTSTTLMHDSFRINPRDDATHAIIVRLLKESKIPFNTFESKNLRPTRVMVKGLHHSMPVDDIFDSLKDQGFNPLQVVNLIKKTKKIVADVPPTSESKISSEPSPESTAAPLNSADLSGAAPPPPPSHADTDNIVLTVPLPKMEVTIVHLNSFAVAFDHDDDIEKILKIKTIANCSVALELSKPNSPYTPVQCKNCQSFNHTSRFCHFAPKCVKCGEDHKTIECPRPQFIVDPKCANCGKSHPANYRKCEIALEVTRERHEILQKRLKDKVNTQKFDRLKEVQSVKPALKKDFSYKDALKHETFRSSDFPRIGERKNSSLPPLNKAVSQDAPLRGPEPRPEPRPQPTSSPDLAFTLNQIMTTLSQLSDRVANLEFSLQVSRSKPGTSK